MYQSIAAGSIARKAWNGWIVPRGYMPAAQAATATIGTDIAAPTTYHPHHRRPERSIDPFSRSNQLGGYGRATARAEAATAAGATI